MRLLNFFAEKKDIQLWETGIYLLIFLQINIPTDFGRIVEKGIYELYLTTNDEVIIKKFRKAIMTLNSTPIQVWCAYMACWNQIFNEHSKYPAPFKMIDDTLLKTLKSTLINNESSLRNCKEWMGINKKMDYGIT